MNPPSCHQYPVVAEDVSFTVPLTVHVEFITKVTLEPHVLHEEMDGDEEGGSSIDVGHGGRTSIRYLLSSYSNSSYSLSSSAGGGINPTEPPTSSSSNPDVVVATEAVFVPASWSGGDWHLCVSEHVNVIRPPPLTHNTNTCLTKSNRCSEYFPCGFLFTASTDLGTLHHHRHHHFRHACRVALDTRMVSVEAMMTMKKNIKSVAPPPAKTQFQLCTLQVPPEASVLLVGDVIPLHATPSSSTTTTTTTTRQRGRPPTIIPPSLTTNLRPEAWMLPLSLRQQLVLLKLSAVHSDWLFPNTTSTTDEEELDIFNNKSGSSMKPYYLSRKPLPSVPIMTPPSTCLQALVERYQEGHYTEDDAAMVIFNPALLSGVNITTTGRFGPRDAIISAGEDDGLKQQQKQSTIEKSNGDDDGTSSIVYHQGVLGNIAAVVDAFGAVISTKLQIGRTDVVIAARADPTLPTRSAIPSKKSTRGKKASNSIPAHHQQPYHEFTTTSKMTALRSLAESNSKAAKTNTKTKSNNNTSTTTATTITSLSDVSNVSPLPQVESVLWLQQCARDLLVFGPSFTTESTNGGGDDEDGCGSGSQITSPSFVPARVAFVESLKARCAQSYHHHYSSSNNKAKGCANGICSDDEDVGADHNSNSHTKRGGDLSDLSIPYSVRILLEGNLWSSLHDQKVDEEIRSLNITAAAGCGGDDTPMRPLSPVEEGGSVVATPGCSTPGSVIPLFSSPMSSPQYISAAGMHASTTPKVVGGGGMSSSPITTTANNNKGGVSPKVSTFTVNAGLLQSLLTSYYKTNKGSVGGSGKGSTAATKKKGRRVDGKPPSEVVVHRSDELAMMKASQIDTNNNNGDEAMITKQPSTLPAIRPPVGVITTTMEGDVNSQGSLVERQLFDKDGKEASSSPTSSPNYLMEVPHAEGESSNASSNNSASSSGSSIFKDPSKPRSANRVVKDRRTSHLTQSTTRMLSTICRSLSLSRRGGGGRGSLTRRGVGHHSVTVSGGKRPRDEYNEGAEGDEEDSRSRVSLYTNISICSPTDNDTSRSTPPGGDSGLQSPQRAEAEEGTYDAITTTSESGSIKSPQCRYPSYQHLPHHQPPPATVVKRHVYVGDQAYISTGEYDDSLLRTDNHPHLQQKQHTSVLDVNISPEGHDSTLSNIAAKYDLTTIDMGGDASAMGGKPLDAIYFASPARSVKLTLIQ